MERWTTRAGRGAAWMVLALAAGLALYGVLGTDTSELSALQTLAVAGFVVVLGVASAVRSSDGPRSRR